MKQVNKVGATVELASAKDKEECVNGVYSRHQVITSLVGNVMKSMNKKHFPYT